MQKKMNYYRVEGTKDGIVLFVYPSRKPRTTKHGPKIQIDEDGIYTWWTIEGDRPEVNDLGKGVYQGALATALNTKRVIREMILPHLNRTDEQIDKVMERLDRIEGKLDRLLASAQNPG